MTIAAHPNLSMQQLNLGSEQAPLLVIDNLVADANALVDLAATQRFAQVSSFYPGIRARAPLSYQQFIDERLGGMLKDYFGLRVASLKFTVCDFSLVTTAPEQLQYLQCIPHVDSLSGNELAFIHYLFDRDLGGTAFYRHRSTGFEVIDQTRKAKYFAQVEEESRSVNRAAQGYINGNTVLYEQIHAPRGLFNRMLIYRRNSLHSGSIGAEFVPDPNPRTGRLSINGFIS
jgi:hypothetical protein